MYDFRYFMIWYKCGKIKNRTKIKKTDCLSLKKVDTFGHKEKHQ